VPDIGNPSTIPFWQRIVMCISEGGKRFISEIRIFQLSCITYYSNNETAIYTFVTNKFISINFLFSLINSSSFVIRLMKNTLIELVQNPTKIVKHSII